MRKYFLMAAAGIAVVLTGATARARSFSIPGHGGGVALDTGTAGPEAHGVLVQKWQVRAGRRSCRRHRSSTATSEHPTRLRGPALPGAGTPPAALAAFDSAAALCDLIVADPDRRGSKKQPAGYGLGHQLRRLRYGRRRSALRRCGRLQG